MNHLDDDTLNEYLDHALGESERNAAKAHMQDCTECRARLDQLQSVFAELDALSEAHLVYDLSPSIRARLPQRETVRVWTRTLAAQLGATFGLLFWLGVQVVPYIRVPQLALPKLPALDVQALVARLLTLQLLMPDFQFPSISYQLPTFDIQIPMITLEISVTQMITLFVLVALLWVIGNAILLRSRQEFR